jgi:hypothetical protein
MRRANFRRRLGRPAPGRLPRSESFMVEAAARACRNGRPLNSSINSNLKAAAAAAAAARQLRLKPEGHFTNGYESYDSEVAARRPA